MKLDFDTLTLDQFGSFTGAPHELDLASFGPGLHFIRGVNLDEPRLEANGSGKSTLFNALCWCLYGKTVDGLRNPDIQARFGKKATRVSIRLRCDGTPHTVTRTTFPNRLLIDEREVGQEQVDALLMGFDLFTNALLYGQGRPLFFDMTPKAKLDLFGTALNQDRWDARAEVASQTTAELETAETTLTSRIASLEGQVAQAEGLLARALEGWRNWKAEQEQRAIALQGQLERLQAEAEQKEAARAGADLRYDGAITELKAILKDIATLGNEAAALADQRNDYGNQLVIAGAAQKQMVQELEALGEADVCPTCGQDIKETDLYRHIAELRRRIKKNTTIIAQLSQKKALLTTQHENKQTEVGTSRANERDFQRKAEAANDEIARLTPVIARLNAEIEQIRASLKAREQEANPYTAQVQELRRTKKQLEGSRATDSKKLVALREQVERTRVWIKGFKEVRLYELEDILQELELATTAALAEVGLVDWTVAYAVEKETKAGTIQRGLNVFIQGCHDDAPVRWECWSGGEQQRLRLVGALALSQVLLARIGVEPMMEILDEPISYLAPGGVEDLCDFLADRAKMLGRMIFYVDHQSIASVRFTSTLTVIKDEGGSRLEI